jgi:hypothetical protein
MPGVAPLGEAPPKNTPPPNIPLEPPAKVVSDENIALFVDNVIKSIRQKIIAQN